MLFGQQRLQRRLSVQCGDARQILDRLDHRSAPVRCGRTRLPGLLLRHGRAADCPPPELTVPAQQQSNWCWAAVATGAAHYYNSTSTVTQCQVVNAQLGRTDCCKNPGSTNCNVTGYVDKALTFVGHLKSEQSSAATYAAVSEAVNVGTPPCIRIGWSGGGGHFIGFFGIEPTNMVWVTDPIYGQSLVSTATLTGGTYQGNGTWTHTYFTQ